MTADPSVVAIGGGHGLAATLRAVRTFTSDVTAIVSVADDGGSSGRLRSDLGIPAVGDLRNCLAALAPPGVLTRAMSHRFGSGELSGHPAGNVMLAGLLAESSDPLVAIDSLAAAMGVVGQVVPATTEPVDLVAETSNGSVRGQVAIAAHGDIRGINWDPDDLPVPSRATTAIAGADMIVLGPGSLYTSVLAAIGPGVRTAIAAAPAPVIYVANLTTEPAETSGYRLGDHVEAITRHGVIVDSVLVDSQAFTGERIASVSVLRADLRVPGTGRHAVELLGTALRDHPAVTVSSNQSPHSPNQESHPR